jgi:opacity protein-like surface antigen
MTRKTLASVATILVLILAMAASASAQDSPKADLSLSYSALNDAELDETFTVGWAASLSGYLTPWLSIVGEAGGHYKTFTESGVDLDMKVHTLLGGVRLGARGSRAMFFAQVLAGGTQVTADLSVANFSESESDQFFTIQPGVGVDVMLSSNVGLRLQADYRSVQDGNEWFAQYRGAAGLVFAFGRR